MSGSFHDVQPAAEQDGAASRHRGGAGSAASPIGCADSYGRVELSRQREFIRCGQPARGDKLDEIRSLLNNKPNE
jgi:hypothetical protein